jgi:nitroimidazol reductase NimA-like FMN-containing flavoprotein (pyridoxamine 5'-phosphate oxidase superfamily)
VKKESKLKTPRTTLGRHPERGIYEPAQIHAILDEALYCNLGLVRDGVAVVLPTLHVRIGDTLYVHGSVKSKLLTEAVGETVCVSVSLMDAIVLARSAFHHSLNYRSVSIYAVAERVSDRESKREIFDALVEQVVPGRLGDCRPPTDGEIDVTEVLAIPINEASAKIRTGPPIEAPGDESLPHWGGLLPLRTTASDAIADEFTAAGAELPEYLVGYERGVRHD